LYTQSEIEGMTPAKKTYTCIIADDSELDRLTLVSYVRRYPFIHISGVFEPAALALSPVQKTTPPDSFPGY
jgi:hypothetical protein